MDHQQTTVMGTKKKQADSSRSNGGKFEALSNCGTSEIERKGMEAEAYDNSDMFGILGERNPLLSDDRP